jgi:hypothetical protein
MWLYAIFRPSLSKDLDRRRQEDRSHHSSDREIGPSRGRAPNAEGGKHPAQTVASLGLEFPGYVDVTEVLILAVDDTERDFALTNVRKPFALGVPDGPVRKELAEGRPVILADGSTDNDSRTDAAQNTFLVIAVNLRPAIGTSCFALNGSSG